MRTVGMDAFSAALGDILGSVEIAADEALDAGVRAGCEKGRDEWKANAPRNTGNYAKSIRFRVENKQHGIEGHVYSKMPGLPHLLEKGHARVGGGRNVPGTKHIEPAAKKAFDETERVVNETLGALL